MISLRDLRHCGVTGSPLGSPYEALAWTEHGRAGLVMSQQLRGDGVPESFLEPAQITDVRVVLTTRCNLRCVYCAINRPDYQVVDMSDEVVARATELIAGLARYNPVRGLGVNGHGETTSRVGWAGICGGLVGLGSPVSMITNLAASFSEEELDVLSSMATLIVSIDSADRELMARIRRRVDLARIVGNISAIRAAAARSGRAQPNLEIACGLYDKNTLGIEGLAQLAIEVGARCVNFWNLAVYCEPDAGISESDRPRPLASLSDAELRPRLEAIDRAERRLQSEGIAVRVDADFISELKRARGL